MYANTDTPVITAENLALPARSKLKLKDEELARWLEQLATLLEAGVALPQALQGLEGTAHNKHWQRLLQQLQDDLAVGKAFSDSLAEHPRAFDTFAVALIRTGELTGQFDLALRRLAASLEAKLRMRRQLLQIMAYPVIVLLVSIGISAFLLLSVVPQFAQLFSDGSSELPWLTAQMLTASDWLHAHWHHLLITLVIGIPILIKLSAKASTWRNVLARLPLLGPLWLQMAATRWATTLGLSTRVGLPFLQGLTLAASNAGHPLFLKRNEEWVTRVRTGEPLAIALHDSPLPRWALQMIAVGQDSGALDTMLDRIAIILDQDTERRVQRLQTILEPLVMVVIGGVVGTLLLGMYLPIFKLASAVG